MEIGNRIRARRAELGLTQQELADELGVTHQHISRIENDQVAPSLDLLVALSARLGTSAEWLLTGQEKPLLSAHEAIRGEAGLSSAAKRLLVALVDELKR